MLLTGLAQPPAVEASQPWLPALVGGRQGTRSINFLGTTAFAVFIALRLVMVLHPYGAPLRLRAATQVGFKMVKWLRAIEFVEAYRQIRGGDGGSCENISHDEQTIPI